MRSVTVSLCRENYAKDISEKLQDDSATLKKMTVRICLPFLNGEVSEDTTLLWEQIASHSSLEELSVQLNGKIATLVAVTNLVDILTKLLVCSPKLIYLHINTMWLEGDIQQLVKAIEQFPALKILHLWQTQVLDQPAGLQPLLSLTAFLEEFKIESCSISKDSPASPQTMGIIAKSQTLQKLTLDEVQDAEVLALLDAVVESGNGVLKYLDFGESKLQLPALLKLSEFLRQNDSIVSLFFSLSEDVSIAPVADSLQSNTVLKRICFCRFLQTTTVLLEEDIKSLQSLLSTQNTTLEEIDITTAKNGYTDAVVDPEIDFYLQLNRSNRSQVLEFIADDHEASMNPGFWIDILSSSVCIV
jgi:hypothetical protein